MSLFSYNAPSKTTSTGMKYSFGTGQPSTTTQTYKDSTPSTSSNSIKLNYFDYSVKRFGVRYDPPTISSIICSSFSAYRDIFSL